MFFSKMCYDVYYHLIKLQFKTPSMHREIKIINCIRVQFWGKIEPNDSLQGYPDFGYS